jgi:uncharacterized membrane protein
MMEQNASAPNKKRRVITIALICSLSLNLLFIGGIIGRYMMGGPPNHLPNNMGWMVRNLNDEQKKLLRPKLKEYSKALRPVRMEMRDARLRLNDVMQSNPLDEAALKSALKDLRYVSNTFQVALHENMVTILKEMKPEDRRAAMKFLDQSERGRRHFKDQRRHSNGSPE